MIPSTQTQSRPPGFTLLEVMVAMAIFSSVMIGLMSAFLYAFTINAATNDQTIAVYAAQAQMETTLSQVYDAVGTGTIESKERIATSTDHYLYPFFRQTDVTYVNNDLTAAGSDTGMKRVDVTVFWENAFNDEEKTYTLTSLMSAR